MSKPKLIDFKLLNDEMNIKMLSLKLDKTIQKINNSKLENPININTNPININTNPINTNPINTNPIKYNKTSILFNIILGLIIISVPAYLYYRHKTKISKFEKDKKLIDIVSKINNKIGLNPEYKSLNQKQHYKPINNINDNQQYKPTDNININNINNYQNKVKEYVKLY